MATRNSYPRDLPKISLIIIIVVFFFCISLVTAASSTSGTDTTTSTKGIGNIPSLSLSKDSSSKNTTISALSANEDNLLQVVDPSKYTVSNLELSQMINELQSQLEDSQTMIDELKVTVGDLKKSNDNLTVTVNNLKKVNDELKLYDERQDFTMKALQMWSEKHEVLVRRFHENDPKYMKGNDEYSWTIACEMAKFGNQYLNVEPVIDSTGFE